MHMTGAERTKLGLGVLIVLASAGIASAQVSATATIAGTPLGGGNFQYDVAFTNTGANSIDTFWFAWIPPVYDFMNVAPTNVVAPTGWIGPVVNDPGEGFSIEAYDPSGTHALAAGATNHLIFDSTETIAQLTTNDGAGPLGGFYTMSTSYIYSGQPETGSANIVVPTAVVPEPVSASLVAVGAAGLMLRRRRAR
jgi:hypothetical protein